MTTHRSHQNNGNRLEAIVRRIVDIANPERIVLFGSTARDEAGPVSDIDLLVIKDGTFHRRATAQEIDRNLSGAGCPVDVVVVHVDDVANFGHQVGTVIEPAMREGRVVYDRSRA